VFRLRRSSKSLAWAIYWALLKGNRRLKRDGEDS
jgi:hypothetical protein